MWIWTTYNHVKLFGFLNNFQNIQKAEIRKHTAELEAGLAVITIKQSTDGDVVTKRRMTLIANCWLKNLKLWKLFYSNIFTPQALFLLLLSELLKPLLGRTRSRGRCWAAIQLSHRPAPSGRAVHGEVDGLDIGGQHGRQFVLLRHTRRPQRRSYPICTSWGCNVKASEKVPGPGPNV